jgi:tripartite-type tricarboxylate transporter receptor subunit TctC
MPHTKTGRLRALGVTSARRLPVISDVPTIAEAGLPGYEVNNCYGLLVPAKTPRPIVAKLNRETVSALHVPERRMQLEGLGFEVLATTSEQFTAFVKTDMAKWARQLKAAGIQPE